MSTTRGAPPHDALPPPRARLPGGGSVVLRPLRRGKIRFLEDVFDGLSPRVAAAALPGADAPGCRGPTRRLLADVDGHDHVAWVALVDGRPAGICRYVRTTHDTAEVAFEVVDAEQGRGIGSALVDAVTTVACAHGVRWLEATVEPGNRASVAPPSRLGVRPCPTTACWRAAAGSASVVQPAPGLDRRAVLARWRHRLARGGRRRSLPSETA